MTIDTNTAIPAIAVLISGLSFLQSRAANAISKENASMQERVTVLEAKVGLFWTVIAQNASALLHQPTHHKLDGYLERLERREELTYAELVDLQTELKRIIREEPEPVPCYNVAAVMFLCAIAMKVHDLTHPEEEAKAA